MLLLEGGKLLDMIGEWGGHTPEDADVAGKSKKPADGKLENLFAVIVLGCLKNAVAIAFKKKKHAKKTKISPEFQPVRLCRDKLSKTLLSKWHLHQDFAIHYIISSTTFKDDNSWMSHSNI